MPKLFSPLLGAAVAAVLMGSTGYCAFGGIDAEPPITQLPRHPPLRLLPEVIETFPLPPIGNADAPD